MRCPLLVSALSLLTAPLAAAQPAEAPADEVIDLDAPERRPAARPAARPAPAAPQPVAPRAAKRDGVRRPVGTTIGIGIGYLLPSDVLEPEVGSVRLRFPGGLTLEPRVDIGTRQTSTELLGVDQDDSEVFVALGTELRLPLASRGPVDFLVVGGAAVRFAGTDPDGDDNSSSVTSLGLSWGVGLDYWLSERWALSATASNPLLSYRTSRTEPDTELETSTFQVGATFDPAFRVMGHIFF